MSYMSAIVSVRPVVVVAFLDGRIGFSANFFNVQIIMMPLHCDSVVEEAPSMGHT
jgi:hypothetical protein